MRGLSYSSVGRITHGTLLEAVHKMTLTLIGRSDEGVVCICLVTLFL